MKVKNITEVKDYLKDHLNLTMDISKIAKDISKRSVLDLYHDFETNDKYLVLSIYLKKYDKVLIEKINEFKRQHSDVSNKEYIFVQTDIAEEEE